MQSRLLISPNKTMIVLDTGPARQLAESDQMPLWVNVFKEMSSQGYSFSLAEIAAAELLAQYHRGSFSERKRRRMLDRLSLFINLEMPVLASKKDVYGMLRLNVDRWEAVESWHIAQVAWAWLKNPNMQGCPGEEELKELLQEERQDWIDHLREVKQLTESVLGADDPTDWAQVTPKMLAELDNSLSKGSSRPPLSLRCHLQSRYRWRQFVRTRSKKDPYNPEAQSKRNDGIDVDLYTYLMLPAFVVTTDNAFLSGLWDIKSFQRDWFVTADDMFAKWASGVRPALTWPT